MSCSAKRDGPAAGWAERPAPFHLPTQPPSRASRRPTWTAGPCRTLQVHAQKSWTRTLPTVNDCCCRGRSGQGGEGGQEAQRQLLRSSRGIRPRASRQLERGDDVRSACSERQTCWARQVWGERKGAGGNEGRWPLRVASSVAPRASPSRRPAPVPASLDAAVPRLHAPLGPGGLLVHRAQSGREGTEQTAWQKKLDSGPRASTPLRTDHSSKPPLRARERASSGSLLLFLPLSTPATASPAGRAPAQALNTGTCCASRRRRRRRCRWRPTARARTQTRTPRQSRAGRRAGRGRRR